MLFSRMQWVDSQQTSTNGLQTPSLLIEKKAGSNLQTVHPFLTTSEADTAGHTTMGSLCSNGASNQIVVGADRCTRLVSYPMLWLLVEL